MRFTIVYKTWVLSISVLTVLSNAWEVGICNVCHEFIGGLYLTFVQELIFFFNELDISFKNAYHYRLLYVV